VELVELDVQQGFTSAVRGRIIVRTIVFAPTSAAWPPTARIEQVSFGGHRIGVCRSWLPDPRLADLNHIAIPEAALLHMAAGITGVRARVTTLTVSTRPAGPDDCADLDLPSTALDRLSGVTIVQIDTTWCTDASTVVLHSRARWRGDYVRVTMAVAGDGPERDGPSAAPAEQQPDPRESGADHRRRARTGSRRERSPGAGPKAA
jgi:hypothetical protein